MTEICCDDMGNATFFLIGTDIKPTCDCEPKDEPCYPHSPPDYGVTKPESVEGFSFTGKVRDFRRHLEFRLAAHKVLKRDAELIERLGR